MGRLVLSLILGIFLYSHALAAEVEATGEAQIVRGDLPAAKNAAVSRAKWAAIEKASGIKVKVDTIINNSSLADEAVKSELSATVESYEIIDEGKDGDVYWVVIKAEIVPDEAKKTMEGFAKNTSVSIIFPAIMPDGSTEFDNAFASALAEQLSQKGFEVADIPSEALAGYGEFVSSSGGRELAALNDLSLSYLTPVTLAGRIKIVPSSRDVGYAKINFSIVNGEISWRLLENKDGAGKALATGSFSSRGQGLTDEAASYDLFKNMARDAAVKVASQVSSKILGANSKSVRVVLKSGGERYIKDLRQDVKNVPFALDVREQGLDAVVVDYPEKTYYLAVFLTRNHKYRIINLDEEEIIVERL